MQPKRPNLDGITTATQHSGMLVTSRGVGQTRSAVATVECDGGAASERETGTRVGTEGEGTGFEAWYRAVHPRLVAAILLSTGRMDDAADVADETMVRALERWNHVRTMASPDGWAFQVAFNLVRRRGRRRALEQTVLRRSAAGRSTTIDGPAGEAWDAVRHLTPRQRQVLVLRYVGDLPEAQIADSLGISRGTVSSTLADAKGALRVALTDPDDPAAVAVDAATPDLATDPTATATRPHPRTTP
jgi:RNA polymerase sigma factor (sigma-70 family)